MNIKKLNIFRMLVFASVTAAPLVCMSCSEDTPADFQGVKGNLVYINQGTTGNVKNLIGSYEVAQTPVGLDAQDMYTVFRVKCTAPAAAEIKVAVKTDNSYVDVFNERNGTAYKALDDLSIVKLGIYKGEEGGVIQMDQTSSTLTIPAGGYGSRDSIVIYIPASACGNISFGEYIIPIDVSSVSGGNSAAPSEFSNHTAYVLLDVYYRNIRTITSSNEIYGLLVSNRSGWVADIGNLFDGNTTTGTQLSNPQTFTVNMGDVHKISGLRLRNYNSSTYTPNVTVATSKDGEEYEKHGTATNAYYYYSSGYQYVAFYNTIEAQYVQLTYNYPSYNSSYAYIYEFDIYENAIETPQVYVQQSGLTGTITQTPVGYSSTLNAEINPRLTMPSSSAVSATIAVDNSLIAAYNAANTTSYGTIPEANVLITDSPVSIAAGDMVAAVPVKVSLTGDLSALTDYANGYLIPLKLTSASGVNQENSVVYVTVTASYNPIVVNPTAATFSGKTIAGRTGWSVTASGANGTVDMTNAVDGTLTTYANTRYQPVTVNIDMGSVGTVSGFRLLNYSATPTVTMEYSADGVTYETVGTASSEYYYRVLDASSRYYQHIGFYAAVSARYVRLTLTYPSSSNNNRLYELDIYE